ncbi:hypothetical protein [Jeotgalibacillus marinus]|uniref:ABC transporter permease n=1 Tax=Jeotgalibacillus marinus TaxID=86667 RepID=A0ABV3Q4M0_9BACL
MNSFRSMFRQPLFYISMVSVLLVVMVLSFAMLGSTIDPKAWSYQLGRT